VVIAGKSPCRFHGHVGAGLDGDADLDPGQCGGVVAAVPDQGDSQAAGPEFG
jgi:hypothetical protein